MAMNNGFIGEQTKIYSQTYSLSSLSTLSEAICVSDCDRVSVIITAGTTGVSTAYVGNLLSTVTIMQGNDTAITTANGLSTATLRVNIGSSAATIVNHAESVYIKLTSGANGGNVGNTVTINGVALTVGTTALGALYTNNMDSTLGTFGSSLLSTVATAIALHTAGLTNLINSTYGSSVFQGGLGGVFRASTVASGATDIGLIRVVTRDDAQLTSGLTVAGTSGFEVLYHQNQAKLEFPVSMINATASTSKWIKVNLSSMATQIPCAITVIKQGARYTPSFMGKSYIAT